MKKEFYRKLTRLVLPIAFQQLMLAIVSASDALMLGRIDQASLSAVSLATQVTFVYNLFLAALTIGASIFAAQYWGKKDKNAVEQILGIAMQASLLISLLFFLGTLLVPEWLMRIFTADRLLIEKGSIYLRIISVTYLFCSVSQIYLCIMKNVGQAARCMVISTVTVVMNIILNALLIYGLFGMPRMEIAGAAAATAVSRAVEVLWTCARSMKKDQIRIRRTCILHPNRLLRRDFWKYTIPVLGNELVWGCGFSMTSVIMGHLGSDAVAAMSIANIVKNLIASFCLGLGSGGGIMVGNELGAGNPERAREYGSRLCRIAVMSGILSGGLIVLLSPLIPEVAELSEVSAGYLRWMLLMCSYYMIGKSVNSTTISGIFCAGGDSRFGFLCDTVTLWCITVPLGLLAAFVLHLPVLAVYFIVNLDEIIKLPAVYRHYRKYRWLKNLTVENLG